MEHWAAVLVVCAAAVAAVYWGLQFGRVLPLERDSRRLRAEADSAGAFAAELLEAQLFPPTPQAFADALRYGVERFVARCDGVHLFVWVRRGSVGAFPESSAELPSRTGMLEALDPEALKLEDPLWDAAFEKPESARWRGAPPDPLGKLSGAVAEPAAELLAWGTRGRIWGVLGALESEPGGGLERHAASLRLLAAYLGALADRTAQHWELVQTREQLEGGLSATIARLDETNLQLIRRAKEMKTLQEITDAISEQPDHAGVLRSVISIVARSLEADLCAFLLLDESTGELVTQPGGFGLSGDEGALYRISLKNEAASSVRVFLSGKPFVTGDAQNDPQVIARYARLWKCHSLMVVPLTVEGRRIGVLRVGSFQRDLFTPEHMQFVRVIAEEAAVLVEGSLLAQKLAEKNRELARLHNLKDDFISTVSHEFKTPLTSIKGFLSVLIDGDAGPLTEEQRRFLRIVNSAAERLGALVSDMLDISRLEAGLEIEMQGVDLEQIARQSVEGHRWQAENRQVRMLLESPPLLPKVFGNGEWLRHVFDNLISNALKFTPERGEVTVSLANRGEGVQACVADTGIGIPEKDRERIFEKFFRASNRQAIKAPGTGLGLAICRQIVDKHEGRIWLESAPGTGSRFYFVVPVAKEAPALDEAEANAPAPEGKAKV